MQMWAPEKAQFNEKLVGHRGVLMPVHQRDAEMAADADKAPAVITQTPNQVRKDVNGKPMEIKNRKLIPVHLSREKSVRDEISYSDFKKNPFADAFAVPKTAKKQGPPVALRPDKKNELIKHIEEQMKLIGMAPRNPVTPVMLQDKNDPATILEVQSAKAANNEAVDLVAVQKAINQLPETDSNKAGWQTWHDEQNSKEATAILQKEGQKYQEGQSLDIASLEKALVAFNSKSDTAKQWQAIIDAEKIKQASVATASSTQSASSAAHDSASSAAPASANSDLLLQIQKGVSLKKVAQLAKQPTDPRGDLLAEIKKGQKLKPVSTSQVRPQQKPQGGIGSDPKFVSQARTRLEEDLAAAKTNEEKATLIAEFEKRTGTQYKIVEEVW